MYKNVIGIVELLDREEPHQNPNKSEKKNVLFSWEFLHGWNMVDLISLF